MKLTATTTALVAVLSIVAGCATDNDGEGGGFTAGLRPAKPSSDDINNQNIATTPHGVDAILNPKIRATEADGFGTLDNTNLVAEQIQSPIKFGNVNIGDAIDVLIDGHSPTDLFVVDGHGGLICQISLEHSRVVWHDCGE